MKRGEQLVHAALRIDGETDGEIETLHRAGGDRRREHLLDVFVADRRTARPGRHLHAIAQGAAALPAFCQP